MSNRPVTSRFGRTAALAAFAGLALAAASVSPSVAASPVAAKTLPTTAAGPASSNATDFSAARRHRYYRRGPNAAGLAFMQRLPPTVAVFQILNEARNARQHWPISGAASQSGGQAKPSNCATVQVAAMERWLSVIVSAGHFRSVRSISRVRWTCGSENSQVPPASQASPAVQTGSCARVCGWATVVMVFKSMDASKAIWGDKYSHFVDVWVAYRYWQNKFGLDHNNAVACTTLVGGARVSTGSCTESSLYSGITVKF